MRRADVTSRARRRPAGKRNRPSIVVLKLGGELLEDRDRMRAVARTIARASSGNRLVVVHGGGKDIDAALAQAGVPKQQVDGLRITDEPTLQVVISVLAGSINTRLVAAINAAGGRAVGLTGADAGVGLVKPAASHRATNGELVDLGFVGEPIASGGAPLVDVLVSARFVPVIACIGAGKDGSLYNVNADTLAASLASRLAAARLIFAGGTAGVLNAEGRTIATLDGEAIEDLVRSGTATAGMVAKLRAGRRAIDEGVADVAIADGKHPPRLAALIAGNGSRKGAWTRLHG
jgi:acetylglutamate kinase